MSEPVRHPRDVVDSLDVGDEFIATTETGAKYGGRVVDGNDTNREAAAESVRVNVEWDVFTLIDHYGWECEIMTGWIGASRDYDGGWEFEVTVVTPDGPETYRADEFEVAFR